MYKILIPLALVALSACVPASPYGGAYGTPAQPDIYDLPAHCAYDAFGQIICNN